jgi:putative hydrolase of the HAD superfamily
MQGISYNFTPVPRSKCFGERGQGSQRSVVMNYKAIIFDLFGTIVKGNTTEEYGYFLSEMATSLRLPKDDFIRLWTVETFLLRETGVFPNIEKNLEKIYQLLGRPVEDSRIKEAARIRYAFTEHCLTPQIDTVETLTALRSAECSLGLISNSSIDVPRLYEVTPLASLIDISVFSCETRLKKPDERIYRLGCELLGVTPQECLYVDDNTACVKGAGQVGLQAVLARLSGEGATSETEWQGPVISSLKEVLNLF